jgi:hypothetical protein
MYSKTFRAALMATVAVAGLWSSAQAAGAAVVGNAAVDAVPPQIRAWLAQQAQLRQTARTQQVADADTVAPRLTAFNAAPSVDVALSSSAMSASFKAVDDVSGVRDGYAWAYGPSGQSISVSFSDFAPSTKLAATMNSTYPFAFLEPGVYTFYAAYVNDFAGNSRYVDTAELAVLGRVSFTVKNKKGFDITPPSLRSGNVLTSRLKLSSTIAGTNFPPVVQMTMVANDTGNTAVAGVHYAIVDFCLRDESSCIYLQNAANESTPTKLQATLRLGGSAMAEINPPGDYHMRSVTLKDFAGNSVRLHSAEFGGSADLNTYFPSTAITLVP